VHGIVLRLVRNRLHGLLLGLWRLRPDLRRNVHRRQQRLEQLRALRTLVYHERRERVAHVQRR
jgi:hypothetical protein